MDKLFKNPSTSNVLLAAFVGVSLVVATAVASGGFGRGKPAQILNTAVIPPVQKTASPTKESKTVLPPAAKTKAAIRTSVTERANLPAAADVSAATINNNTLNTNTAAANSTSTAAVMHFSVSGGEGDDGGSDDGNYPAALNQNAANSTAATRYENYSRYDDN
jgi:hypothetical protein